jgi:myo-inositol-1(or 4)-monophosphatase
LPATDAATSLDDDLDLIRVAAEEAGRIAMGYYGRDPQVWMKAGMSPVSEADYAVDRFLKETLRSARPDYGWLSEETVDTPERLSAARTFVVDPIDGTRAFLERQDVWCVSIAVVERGRPTVGVLDCPARREIFAARAGAGATLDGSPLAVRSVPAAPAIAGPKAQLDALPPALSSRISRHRYVPSLAYRIAMIAAGRLDGTFVKANSHDWDLAAADLILSEAGGSLVGPDGDRLRYAGADPRRGRLVAGSGLLLDEMVAVTAAMGD